MKAFVVGWLRHRRVAVVALVGLLLAVAALSAWRLQQVASDLRAAEGLLTAAGASLEDGDIGSARAGLEEAEGLLLAANNRLATSPELQLVGVLPVVEQNLDALRRSVATAYQLVAGGAGLLETTAPLEGADGRIQVPLIDGRVPLGEVSAASEQLQSLAATLPGASDLPPDLLLLPSVRDLQERVYAEAIDRRNQLDDLAQGMRLLTEMAGGNGPRRYVLAIANTAEMRGTGGMVLSYGVLESANGSFDLTTFGPIDELFLRAAVPADLAPIEPDEAARWVGREPTRLWRNANLIPDFTLAGPRFEALYETATGLPADGVIQVDAAGLAAILEGIGPVEVPELGVIDAANVVDVTLNEAYRRFPDDEDQRREVLGDVAEVVFDRLVDGNLESLRPLAAAILRAVQERHIVVYGGASSFAVPATFFGGTGVLPPPEVEAFQLTVQNFGRDKLDYYLDTSVSVTGARPVGQESELEVVIRLTNGAPPGEDAPAYIFGTDQPRGDADPGTYLGVVSLYVPTGASIRSSSGDATSPVATTTEVGRTVVGFDVEVPAGQVAEIRLTLALPPRPPGGYGLVLTPVARVRPTSWVVEISDGAGATVRRSGPLLTVEVDRPA